MNENTGVGGDDAELVHRRLLPVERALQVQLAGAVAHLEERAALGVSERVLDAAVLAGVRVGGFEFAHVRVGARILILLDRELHHRRQRGPVVVHVEHLNLCTSNKYIVFYIETLVFTTYAYNCKSSLNKGLIRVHVYQCMYVCLYPYASILK